MPQFVYAHLRLKDSHIMPISFIEALKMGAYVDKKWCPYKSWKQVVKKRQKLVLGPHYRNVLHGECIIAAMVGYNTPLLEKILEISLPSEIEYVIELFSNEIDIKFINGNIVISN
jgi:hypothetical protein